MIDTRAIRLRWEADGSKRDERGKRLFAASEARAAGWGGVGAVAAITGLARSRIIRGLKDLAGPALAPGRVRRAGGGRHTVTATDSMLLGNLKRLVEPATMGDPMRPLTWVSKSREKLACELNACGHDVSRTPSAGCWSTSSITHGKSTADTRGREPSRSKCTVRAHQRAGDCGPVRVLVRHFGRHQEEGADWQLQEWRHGLSAQRRPAGRERPRFQG